MYSVQLQINYDIIEVDNYLFNVNLKILMMLPFNWNFFGRTFGKLVLQFYFFGFSGVWISTDDQRNDCWLLYSKKSAIFFSKEEATSFYNAINKKYIIKSDCKLILCNFIEVFAYRFYMLCFIISYYNVNAVFQ